MLDYIKLILQKVSFDKKLFEKELRKAIARLMPKEVVELKKWCYQHFSNTYYLILDRCFTISMV
jgi:hypothetical protein